MTQEKQASLLRAAEKRKRAAELTGNKKVIAAAIAEIARYQDAIATARSTKP